MYNSLVPVVVEQTPNGERSYDIYSRLMKDRIVILGEEVNQYSANRIVASLLYLDSTDKKDIYFYINSPGGSVYAGLAIYDTIKSLRSDVSTICTGYAASMGAFLLAGGTKGKRFALPNSNIMLHNVSSGTQGNVADIIIAAKQTEKLNERLQNIMAENTNKDLDVIKDHMNRDFWLDAVEARDYGVIDNVIEKIPYEEKNEDFR